MCRHKNLDGLPKHFPKKIHKAPGTVCYTTKTTTINKGTAVDTSYLQPVELVYIDFSFYKITSICGFTFIITVVCAKTRILWVFPTASKITPVHVIRFILTTLMNEQHPCKCVRADVYSSFANSTDVTNLLVDELKISMETTGGDASWLNGNNKRHNRSIHNMVRAALLYIHQHENKCCCAAEKPAAVHICRIHSALKNISTHFAWYGKNPSIHKLRKFGCAIYPITSSTKNLYNITQEG